MEIINTHTHLIEIEKVLSGDNSKYIDYLKDIPTFESADDVVDLISLENLLKQMDEANVSKSVLFAMYAPILQSSNEFVASICKAHPDRFIGFASVDTALSHPEEMLEEAVEKHALKGLKLHPPLQNFYPNDKAHWPLYAKARDLGIPVVFHVGTTPFGSLVKLKQANPILIDDIANDFPDLKIILTHLGTLWHNESFMVVEKHPNLYIDTAAYPYEIKELLNENLIRRVGESKFIFGTDFPMPYEGRMHRLKDFTDIIHSLDISDELKARIFSINFKELMADLI